MRSAEFSTDIDRIELDIWKWITDFVAAKSPFYDGRFAPCPYAAGALHSKSVDVKAWSSGDFRKFVRDHSQQMHEVPHLTTRVMIFPPRAQRAWGLLQFVEGLNAELIPHNVFLNTGIAKTTVSRYPGSSGEPYFVVIANSLDAVLKGADALTRTNFYDHWPKRQFDIVVNRRERLYKRYGRAREQTPSHER